MNTQPEALRLAEMFSSGHYANSTAIQAAIELRRLYAVNQELLEWSRAVVRYAGSSCDDYLAEQARAAIDKAEWQA